MPRTAKRTQPVRAPQDQGYGERGDQIAAQQAMPLPDNRSLPEAAPAPAGVTSAPGVGAPAPDPVRAALEGAQAMPGGSILAAPGDPNVPITAGLASGPGPGPEALTPETPKRVTILQEIARLTDDPALVALINRAVERR